MAVDGTYGEATAEAVRVFQGIFNLPKTGVVDYATWYRISDIYVGVTRIAELRSENIFYPPNSREMIRGGNSAPFFNYPNRYKKETLTVMYEFLFHCLENYKILISYKSRE